MTAETCYVIASTLSAELYWAMTEARGISFTASTAKALALRAGSTAAGFSKLTDFIDELATIAIESSQCILNLAIDLSRTATAVTRSENTLRRFNLAKQKAKDAKFVASLDTTIERASQEYNDLQNQYNRQVLQLEKELGRLAKELKKAQILATMSRVEAAQAMPQFRNDLRAVAHNVLEAAEKIQQRVKHSLSLFDRMETNNDARAKLI